MQVGIKPQISCSHGGRLNQNADEVAFAVEFTTEAKAHCSLGTIDFLTVLCISGQVGVSDVTDVNDKCL